MKDTTVIGGSGIGKIAAINAILRERGIIRMIDLSDSETALHDLSILFADPKIHIHDINLIDERINPNYIYEKPQSKFI